MASVEQQQPTVVEETKTQEEVAPAAPAPVCEAMSAPEKAFESMDADKDGLVSKEELTANLKSLACAHLSAEQLDGAFENADADKDGKITLEEFKAMVNARQEA